MIYNETIHRHILDFNLTLTIMKMTSLFNLRKNLRPAVRFLAFFSFLILSGYSCSLFNKENPDGNTGKSKNVVVYPALPDKKHKSDRYEVTVSDNSISQDSYVYRAPNNDQRWFTFWPDDEVWMTAENHFTSFSFKGSITVKVTLPKRSSISSVVVRPLSEYINASISGNTVTFSLDEPANLYVEIDGEKRYPLFIFANPPEKNIPAENDPGVVYFGPGIHDVGIGGNDAQKIQVGKTVYIAGGAYIKGVLKTTGGTGTTTIRGRGIISGIDIQGLSAYNGMIEAGSGSLIVEGITILDAPQGYQGVIAYGDNSSLENVKMLSWAMESDAGALGQNSQICNCFFKINDDVLKPNSTGMEIRDNVVWQQMCGSVVMLGWNCTEKGIRATISGLDIIGCDRGAKPEADWTNHALINLRNINGATYTGIVIENVRIEKRPFMLFALDVKVTARTGEHFVTNPLYNKGLGCVDGLTFRNFTMTEVPLSKSYFNGNGNITPESTGDIRNVTFENVDLAGTLLTGENADNYLIRMGNTSNFVYK